jgi:predicted RNase H-like nuclease (RuvC/YqgF family)
MSEVRRFEQHPANDMAQDRFAQIVQAGVREQMRKLEEFLNEAGLYHSKSNYTNASAVVVKINQDWWVWKT